MAKKKKITVKLPKIDKSKVTKIISVVKKLFGKVNIKIVGLILGVAVLALLVYLAKGLFIAAVVNGQPITRLSILKDLESQGGKSVLDNLIEKSIISQEAKKQKIQITKDEITSEVAKIEEALKAQGMTLDEALALRGQKRADLESQMVLQKTVEKILSEKIQVSDEEIKSYFTTNRNVFDKKATLESSTETIRETLLQSKLNSEYQTWIDELKAKANVLYFVNY